MGPFEPDQITLGRLQAEHQNGVWVGRELLPIANRIRNDGGSEDDYTRWVRSSHLWASYTGSTGDSASDQSKSLESAWDKSEQSKPFELEDALSDLMVRIATGRWAGPAGSRNRAVALAFVGFCRDHNCFTRTMSRYELAKHTPGISPNTVGKGLDALVNMGLLTKVDRSDRRSSGRSTTRYRIDLYWKPNLYVNDSKSTSKYSLTRIRTTESDIWSYAGLGLTAQRAWEVLADEPQTVREVGDKACISRQQAARALAKLADNCLAGVIPGRPIRYFAVETPLSAVADALGIAGYVDAAVEKVEHRQHANRTGYPLNYNNQSQRGTTEYGH